MKKYVSFSCLMVLSIVLLLPMSGHSQITSVSTTQYKQSRRIHPKFNTYISPRKFSIQYPKGWFIRKENSNLIIIQNFRFRASGTGTLNRGDIKTDIYILNQSFESVRHDRLVEPKIKKQSRLTIGGREAFRIRREDSSFGGEYVQTIIRYRNNQTFEIVSFAEELTSSMVNTIETIHGSFRTLE